MPSVIDAPEVVEHGHHDLYEEQPRVYVTRAGFWRTVVEYVRQHRARNSSRTRSSSHLSLHHLHLPMAQCGAGASDALSSGLLGHPQWITHMQTEDGYAPWWLWLCRHSAAVCSLVHYHFYCH